MEHGGVQIPGVVVDEIQHHVPAEHVALAAPSVAIGPAGNENGALAPSETLPPVVEQVSDPQPAAPVTAPAGEEATTEKKKPSPRGTSMAAGGRPIEAPGPAPARPTWPAPRNPDETYVPEEFDTTDLSEVNREMNGARARIFRVSQQLKLAQRTLAEAQSDYDREMRRQLVTISGGTEASRKALAEIHCEPYENRIIVGKQVVEEWRKRSMDCRDDLKAIENLSHNVRAQMDVR